MLGSILQGTSSRLMIWMTTKKPKRIRVNLAVNLCYMFSTFFILCQPLYGSTDNLIIRLIWSDSACPTLSLLNHLLIVITFISSQRDKWSYQEANTVLWKILCTDKTKSVNVIQAKTYWKQKLKIIKRMITHLYYRSIGEQMCEFISSSHLLSPYSRRQKRV